MADLSKIHKQALDRFERIETNERKQRDYSVEDRRFVNAEDGQWDEEAKTRRANRPRYTINRVAGAQDQLIGDQRQNKTSIKVIPESGKSDKKKADILSGLIRNIESTSKADDSYNNAYDETTGGGYGGWRILTEFNDDDIFEQDISIAPILSADTSLFFGPSERYDKRDAPYGFLISNIAKEEFNDEYPDAVETEWPTSRYSASNCSNWFSEDNLRIAEYWVKEQVTKEVALLSDGRIIDMEAEKAVLDELEDDGLKIVKQRTVKSHKIVMYKMNGAEILEGPSEWAGKYIPLVPMYGKVSNIEKETFVRGLIRFAKDPQRIYNYSISSNIEAVALTPKDPYWYDPRQSKGFKQEYENFNKKNSPFMPYNSEPTVNNGGPPQRTGAPSVQTALLQQVQQAGEDIFLTTNMGPPSVGLNPGLQSGVALQRQDEKGDRGSYIYQDNLTKSKEYSAEILIDLIPKIYDTPRTVRTLNLDDSTDMVEINQEELNDLGQPVLDEETGNTVIVNDLTVGKYSVKASTGPAFTTMRQESAQQLIELAAASPVFEQVATDLIAKNINVIEGDELHGRVRKLMIQQGTVQPTDDEIKELGLDQPQQEDPNAVALRDNVAMQTADLMSQIEKRDAERDKILLQAVNEANDGYKTLADAFKTFQETGIPLGKDEVVIKDQQAGLVELAQDGVVQDEVLTSEQNIPQDLTPQQ